MALNYAGRLSDGRSAAQRAVSVSLDKDGIAIAAEDGGAVAKWAFPDVMVIGEALRGQPLSLGHQSQEGARLTLEDRGFTRPLYALAPHLRKRGYLGPRPWRRAGLAGAAVVAAVAGVIWLVPLFAEPVAALIPVSWEEKLGAGTAAQFTDESNLCTDPAGVRALEALTGRLAGAVVSPYSFDVRVIEAKDVNAFAAPGGFIVIYSGLIDFAESPEEVAGVLAHEMGHVVERHGTESMVRALGLYLILTVVVGDPSGVLGLAASAAEVLIGLSYSRGDEAEADAVAVSILETAGIRVGGFASFFARASGESDDTDEGVFALLSSHPPDRERARTIAAADDRGGGPAMSADEWRALRGICG